jgi:excisionase family DNA binding protein
LACNAASGRVGFNVLQQGAKSMQEQTKGPSRLLTVEAVASMLDVSKRTVYRLSDAGRMPRPVKLGGAVRWDGTAISSWIAAGCPNVDKGGNQR